MGWWARPDLPGLVPCAASQPAPLGQWGWEDDLHNLPACLVSTLPLLTSLTLVLATAPPAPASPGRDGRGKSALPQESQPDASTRPATVA